MKILVSSGGTKVPIDPVRDITNMSKGTFGSEIAKEALIQGHDVIYLISSGGKTPFSATFDFYRDKNCEAYPDVKRLFKFSEQYKVHYNEYRYRTFNEYYEILRRIMTTTRPDVTILSAAVSDFQVANYSETKERSSESHIINLVPTPKVINEVKNWCPDTFLVGFKLLVHASESALIEAAKVSIEKNRCDLVVANDLITLQQGKHEILLVEKDGTFTHHASDLAKTIIQRVTRES